MCIHTFPTDPDYARAVGRHGGFVPRQITYAIERHPDGTAMLHITVRSRRMAEDELAPVEVLVKLESWQRMALAVARAAQDCACSTAVEEAAEPPDDVVPGPP